MAPVALNRPHRKNALTATMLDRLRRCLEDVERRPEDRALVLTGAGGDVCSGADLGDPDSPIREGEAPYLAGADAAEDMRAFIEKRQPHFVGR